ncbi:MAG TPA: AAA domain-containing protein [Myxococcota bacterium]|nr:AAA domain-containing protein [Myxococcota bacterium]
MPASTGHPHIDALLLALDREKAAIEEEIAQLRAQPLPARAALGFTWYPLDLLTVEYRSKGRMNVVLRGQDLHAGIGAGDPVVLAPLGRPDQGWSGRCEGADGSTVELRVDGSPDGKGPWAVSRRLDHSLMDKQADALRRAVNLKGPLAALLLGRESPYRPDPWESACFSGLDPSQRAAAELALGATEVGLLHGPPGTGKTRVLVAILQALKERGERAWALADSNMAVDHLALTASRAGLDVVRLGVSARIGLEVSTLALEHRILHGARAAVIQKLLRQATRASGLEQQELRAAINEEWSAAKREILENADVVAMTLGTLHTRGEGLTAPRTAVVDEATQIWEPALWLLASRVKRLILAGDPQQLGPVVKSRDPVLERSLLQRLGDEGFPFPMLDTQYRMNDALLRLCGPNYPGRLHSHPSVAGQRLVDLGIQPGPWTDPPARFVDTAGVGLEEEPDGMGSYANPGELRVLEQVLTSLRAGGLQNDQVGIITPYSAQLRAIHQRFPGIESGSVNAFQGREKEVILASFVRSNGDQEVGFVADPRRLNVSVSRARRLFVGVGDSETLGTQPMFRKLLEAVGEGYLSAWELETG